MPVLHLRPHDKIYIVPGNFVGKAIVTIHQKDAPGHGIYHLSSGMGSQTYLELTDAIAQAGGMRRPVFSPWLGGPFSRTVNLGAKRSGAAGFRAFRASNIWPGC